MSVPASAQDPDPEAEPAVGVPFTITKHRRWTIDANGNWIELPYHRLETADGRVARRDLEEV